MPLGELGVLFAFKDAALRDAAAILETLFESGGDLLGSVVRVHLLSFSSFRPVLIPGHRGYYLRLQPIVQEDGANSLNLAPIRLSPISSLRLPRPRQSSNTAQDYVVHYS